MKKFSVVFLAVILMICMVSIGVFAENRTTDPATLDMWKKWFGPDVTNTVNAGGVWTDKTVQKNADYYKNVKTTNTDKSLTMSDPDENFLVTMSVLGNNKSITGYSYLPTDTMLVLDVSASMLEGGDSLIVSMVNSANDAIETLLGLNNYNRVGVVLYSGSTEEGSSNSGTATLLLPLERYKLSGGLENYLEITYNNNRVNSIRVNPSLVTEDDEAVADTSKRVTGGTYMQNGIDIALDEFLKQDTTISPDAPVMAGKGRIPIIALLSDGAPTTGTTNYANVGISNLGDGTYSSDAISFVTQLTAANAKAELDKYYAEGTPLFYTLGIGISENEDATAVMDPSESSSNINGYWDAITAVDENGEHSAVFVTGNRSVIANENITDASQKLYVDQYFPADNAVGLAAAFNSIVEQIIIQSKYYATSVIGDANYSGYITYIDNIGKYMEVIDIKGMVFGDTYFDGSDLSENFAANSQGGQLGTYEDPTALGDEFIWAVKERLGITDPVVARNLVTHAYNYGQLYYNSADDFGNLISIYTDADGNYLGFYDEDFTEPRPSNAKYIVDTYGFLDSTADDADGSLVGRLLYISVAVQTDIDTGEISVIWKIPATMIPMLTREFTVESDTISEGAVAKMSSNADTVSPLRLVYEVGLRSDINELNVADIVDAEYAYKTNNGTYNFYTNAWNADQLTLKEGEDIYNFHPSEGDNAVAYFHPNEANERYYYIEDSAVYYLENGEYKKYTGSAGPAGDGYYRALGVFDWSDPELLETGSAKYTFVYEPIMANALAEAKQLNIENGDNTWYVPAGTARGRSNDEVLRVFKGDNFDTAEIEKNNQTATLEYSNFGSYEYFTETVGEGEDAQTNTIFIADAIMGNNGLLNVTPAQGIAITKTIDAFLGTEPEFTFTITAPEGADVSNAQLTILDADGTYSDAKVLSFSDGVATVTIMRNQTAYVHNIGTGIYVVTESDHADYNVQSVTVNGDESANPANVTVSPLTLTKVAYANKQDQTGNLIIRKNVNHPYGSNYTVPEDVEFTFEVDLGTDYVGETVTITGETDPVEVPDDGKLTVKVKSGASVAIRGIDDGTKVTVTEVLPEGSPFTVDQGTQNATIAVDTNSILTFVNTYFVSDVYPIDISLRGQKHLLGRGWNASDRFEVVLGYRDPAADGSVTEIARAAFVPTDTDYNFTEALKADIKKRVEEAHAFDGDGRGTYVYTVREVAGNLGGITYDNVVSYIDVIVTDTDMDGKYEVSKVTGAGNAEITNLSTTSFNIAVDFTNTYAVAGNARVNIEIEKTVSGREDFSRAGFEFGLYALDEEGGETLIAGPAVTDANGKATIPLLFTAANVGNYYEYVVKEIVGDHPEITYSDKVYPILIHVVDNLDGTIGAIVTDEEENPLGALVFDNEVNDVLVKDVKNASGITVDGEAVNTGDILTYTIRYTNITSGPVDVTITDNLPEGTTLVENSISGNGVYSDGVITWNVEDVAVGDKVDVSFSVKVGEIASIENIAKAVVNEYAIESNPVTTTVYTPVSIELTGTKTLEGRELTESEFEFVLMEGEEVIDRVRNNDDGVFAFGAITYNTPGEFTYTVKEVNSGALGVIFDTTVYEVKVVVTADENGKLVATVTGADAITFKNTYSVGTPQKSVFDEAGLSVDGKIVSFGEELTYTIEYINVTADAVNIEITDMVPTHTTYVEGSADPEAAYVDGILTWNFENVASGESVKVSFKAKVSEVATIENEAITTISKGDEQIKSNKVTTTVDTILNREDHFGYIIGYPEHYLTGEYTTDQTVMPVKPEGLITRAEVATIYFRMLKDADRAANWTQENPYNDVSINEWFNNAVSVLTNFGILHGDPTGNFRPNDPITRAEFAAIAGRFYASVCDCENDHFSDISGHWAQDEINKAAHNNLIRGYEDGTYLPNEYIKRSEAVTIVNRTLERAPSKDHFLPDMLKWVDNMNTEVWYYADMQEATNSHEYEKLTAADGTVYEVWTKMLPIRDWAAFEKEWSDANSAQNPGEVVR